MFNKQVAMSEAEANAKNRAANQSRTSANVANLGTMAGEMSRDEKMMIEQAKARKEYFDLLKDQDQMIKGYGNQNIDRSSQVILPPGYNPDLMADIIPEEDMFSGAIPLYNPSTYRFADGGNLTHRLRLRNFKTAS